jgi:hypothetical protein
MPSDPRTQELRDRLAWFRWEFIRRNKAYQQEQEAFQAKFGGWFETNGYWWDQHGPIYSEQFWYHFCSEIAPAASLICERWDLTDPLPSSWQFDMESVRVERGTKILVPTHSSGDGRRWNLTAVDPALYPDANARFLKATGDIPDVIKPSWNVAGDPRVVRIEIDVAEPMQQILAYVQERVERQKSFYKTRLVHYQTTTGNQRRGWTNTRIT